MRFWPKGWPVLYRLDSTWQTIDHTGMFMDCQTRETIFIIACFSHVFKLNIWDRFVMQMLATFTTSWHLSSGIILSDE